VPIKQPPINKLLKKLTHYKKAMTTHIKQLTRLALLTTLCYTLLMFVGCAPDCNTCTVTQTHTIEGQIPSTNTYSQEYCGDEIKQVNGTIDTLHTMAMDKPATIITRIKCP
jgi:hypothetical protein